MQSEDLHLSDKHLSDQEMLLAADGELSTRQAAQVHSHLAECWACRARMAEIEETIADFARAHRQTLDPQLPPIAGPRALLRAQLAELVSKREAILRAGGYSTFTSGIRAAAFLCAVVLVATVVGRIFVHHSTLRGANSIVAAFERGALPDRSLTPGATRRVAISDVCSMAHEQVVGEVSVSSAPRSLSGVRYPECSPGRL